MVQKMYPAWIDEFREKEEATAIPYQPPAALPLPSWLQQDKWPHFALPELINGIFRCQRCGICLSTSGCQVMELAPGEELFTPRARIALIRALLEERMTLAQIPIQAMTAGSKCNFCGHCSQKCIVNVSYREQVSQEKIIDHQHLFRALAKLLAERMG